MEKELKIGDAVWYIPDGYLLAVKCKIIEIDDEFDPVGGIIFYDIDEPVGHDLYEDELFLTKKAAEAALLVKYENRHYKYKDSPAVELDLYRKRKIKFIVSTWELLPQEKKREIDNWYNSLPPKIYNESWFNLASLVY